MNYKYSRKCCCICPLGENNTGEFLVRPTFCFENWELISGKTRRT